MKKTGKWLAKLLAVALLVNLLPVFAMAADRKDSTPGINVIKLKFLPNTKKHPPRLI